jgi:hypothetical protein
MAQAKETPSQLIEEYMNKNNYPISNDLLSYIMVVDMVFRREIQSAYMAGVNNITGTSPDKYYHMTFIDND